MAAGKTGVITYYEMESPGLSTCDKKTMEFYIQKGHSVVDTYDIQVLEL